MQKLTDLLAMGGYGSYVWPSFAAATIIMGVMVIASWRSLKRAQKALMQLQSGDET